MIKVLITKREYDSIQIGYGTYRDVGAPNVAMQIVEFDTRAEAEAFCDKHQDKPRYYEVEILN